jgi:hypothetical protein
MVPARGAFCSVADRQSIENGLQDGRAHVDGKGDRVNGSYDIFEKLQDGAVLWRECVAGREETLLRLAELGRQSKNEFFALYTLTGEIVGRVNAPAGN